MFPDPSRELRIRTSWIDFDVFPFGVLEELSIGEAEFLGTGVPDEAWKKSASHLLIEGGGAAFTAF